MAELDPRTVMAIMGGVVAFVTMIWHLGIWAGRISLRMERAEKKIEDLEDTVSEFKGAGV